jgi:hypothetical protein
MVRGRRRVSTAGHVRPCAAASVSRPGAGHQPGVSRRSGEERTDRASSIEDGEMAQRRVCLGRRGMARKLGFERTMRGEGGADGRRSSDEP